MLKSFLMNLLENSLILSAAIVLLWVLSRVLRDKTSPRLRIICWTIVAAGLLLPVRPSLYTVALPEKVSASIPAAVSNVFAEPEAPIALAYGDAMRAAEAARSANAVKTDAENPGNETEAAPVPPSDTPHVSAMAALLYGLRRYWLFAAWAAGAAVFMLLCVVRHVKFARHIRRWSRAASDESPAALLEEARCTVGLRRKPRLLICPLVTTPVMMGLFRPLLILPDEGIEPERLRFMLFHEVLHCKRGDIWIKLLSLAALAAHWFNPLVYLMNRAIITEAELACDAAVVRHSGASQRIAYGETILFTARRGREVSTMLASAFSGNSKNLKRRLAAIVEHAAPKKWVAICCAVVMVAGLLMAGMVSCDRAGNIDPIPQAKIDLTPTDELLIYLPSTYSVSRDLQRAIPLYERLYPDVNLIVETIGGSDSDWETYKTLINTELMAGSGPDIVVYDTLYFPDIYKTMDMGAFLDLDTIIEQDESFDMGDYYGAVLDAGVYKGGRYLVPWAFSLPMFGYLPSALDTAGFDMSKSSDAVSFYSELGRVIPTLKENPAFKCGIGFTNFVQQAFKYGGIKLMDYEFGGAMPDADAFRALCEAYKPYWETDAQSVTMYYGNQNSLFDGDILFSTLGDFPDYPPSFLGFAKTKDTEVGIFVLSSTAGEINAIPQAALAINSNSRNQPNAWNFIKVMISTLSQSGENFHGPSCGYPVNRQALRSIVDIFTTQFYTIEGNRFLLTNEEVQPIYDMLNEITGCEFSSSPPWQFFRESMTPYFTDVKSYDECFAELQSKLALYVSE